MLQLSSGSLFWLCKDTITTINIPFNEAFTPGNKVYATWGEGGDIGIIITDVPVLNGRGSVLTGPTMEEVIVWQIPSIKGLTLPFLSENMENSKYVVHNIDIIKSFSHFPDISYFFNTTKKELTGDGKEMYGTWKKEKIWVDIN